MFFFNQNLETLLPSLILKYVFTVLTDKCNCRKKYMELVMVDHNELTITGKYDLCTNCDDLVDIVSSEGRCAIKEMDI